MRVLFWSEMFPPYIGGIEKFGEQQVRTLLDRGHQVTVVTSHHFRELPDEDKCGGAQVYRFPFRAAVESGSPQDILAVMGRASALWATVEPDLIHVNGLGVTAFYYLRLLARRPVPLLVTVQNELVAGMERAQDSLQAKVLRDADWTVAVSRNALDQAQRWVPAITPCSSVIHNMVRPPSVEPAPLAFDPPTLLCFGRLVPAKGFDLALEAFSEIATACPSSRLVMAGHGPEADRLEQQVKDLNLCDRVVFRPEVPFAEVPELLNQATVVLMPSRMEGLPLAAVETAMMGRPIVAARAGGLPEVVRDGQTGLLVDKEDVTGLANAVTTLLRDPVRATAMGRQARSWALEHFNWKTSADAYEALYERLLHPAEQSGGRT